MQANREWVAAGVLGVFGLVFALALVEAGVRLLRLVPDRFWEHDPVLGVRLVPGATGTWSQEDREFVVPVAVNDHGRRDVERPWEKPPGVRRVLVLGDSFVEAMQVPLEETFYRQLEAALDARAPGVRHEVLGAGVSGYGTAGAVLYYERDGRRYAPDLVLLAFYPGNDVRNNSPTLEDRFPPVYDDAGVLVRVEGPTRDASAQGGWLPEWKTKRHLRRVILTQQPQIAAALVSLGLLRPEAVRAVPEENGIPVAYGVFAEPLPPAWRDAWERTEALVERLATAAGASGARFSVAIGSVREQVYPELWREILAQHPAMAERAWNLDAPQQRIASWCERRGVPCIALAPHFRSAAEGGESQLHFRHDGHWTAAGHRLVAEVLTDFVARQLDAAPPD